MKLLPKYIYFKTVSIFEQCLFPGDYLTQMDLSKYWTQSSNIVTVNIYESNIYLHGLYLTSRNSGIIKCKCIFTYIKTHAQMHLDLVTQCQYGKMSSKVSSWKKGVCSAYVRFCTIGFLILWNSVFVFIKSMKYSLRKHLRILKLWYIFSCLKRNVKRPYSFSVSVSPIVIYPFCYLYISIHHI